MRILLDTHVLLWALTEPDKLSLEGQALIRAARNKVLFSAASVWELAIKAQIGRSNIPISLSELIHAATRVLGSNGTGNRVKQRQADRWYVNLEDRRSFLH
jgi:PIN domain nuclease of toxin-antitoxin system